MPTRASAAPSIMRHDQPTTPFDVEADELTQQFWGTSKGWVSSEQPTVPRRAGRTVRRDDTTGSLRAIRDGFAAFRPQTAAATGELRRQRYHGVPQRNLPEPEPTPRREATLGELAAGRSDVGGWLEDEWPDEWPDDRWQAATARHDRVGRDEPDFDEPDYDVPLSPVQPLVERLGLGAVDPLLVRAGMIVLALVLLVPLALSLRPDRTDSLPGDVVESPLPVDAATGAPLADPTSSATVDAAAGADADGAAPARTEPSPEPSTEAPTVASSGESRPAVAADAVAESADEPTIVASAGAADGQTAQFDAADVDVAAERVVPACPQTYTAAAGDSWYRIADEAGVSPRELLAENNATTGTVILPGDEICLPEGATMPDPPSVSVPTVTEPDDEPASTTVAPTTTAPPTTVAPLTRAEVQQLIRETWPEEEVATALAVAERESNFVATADNGWCCVGVFQLYWTVHRGWLDDFGITERSHLYDARKNVAAAYHMWQTQGWGPWNG